MDDCERKYLKDQLRTLQMKCDLLSQQSEHQQQMILHMKSNSSGSKAMKDEDEEEGRNRVGKHSLPLSFNFFSSFICTLYFFDIIQALSTVHNILYMVHDSCVIYFVL